MNEYDSIKRFINCVFSIIIICFFIWDLSIIFWFIKSKWIFDLSSNLFHECLFLSFMIYFLTDLVKDFNDERFMFFPEHYIPIRYKVVRIVNI